MEDRPGAGSQLPFDEGTSPTAPAPMRPAPSPGYDRGVEAPAQQPSEHGYPGASRRSDDGRSGGGRMFLAAIVGGLVGALLVGGGFYLLTRSQAPGVPAVTSTSAVTSATPEAAEQPLEAAVGKVLPSVVNVAIDTQFGSGVGSGIIIRSDGYILTNNHVVEGATKVTVHYGTKDYAARVVGTDPTSDLAVIKIAKTGLPAATLGSARTLQVGETVLAIGSPFGLDKTVTSGIVSALHRSNLSQNQTGVTAYTDLIQTDAAINPGNSGGALADLTGAVVGINALIESPSGQLGAGQSAGIGFAIPIDFAKAVADQIIAGKPVTHPYLGISSVTVTAAFAQQNSLPVDSGALVQQVTAGSPAAAAGIRAGDIIVRIGDQTITSSEDVFTAVRGSAVGSPIAIEVVRNGAHVTLTATLVAR
jgi:putative serine protease PepD